MRDECTVILDKANIAQYFMKIPNLNKPKHIFVQHMGIRVQLNYITCSTVIVCWLGFSGLIGQTETQTQSYTDNTGTYLRP